MHIYEYLDILDIYNIKNINPTYEDIIKIFKNNTMIDSVYFKIKKEYKLNTLNTFENKIYNLSCISDIIKNIKTNIPINIIIDNKKYNKLENIFVNKNNNIKIQISKENITDKFKIEYEGYVFSNLVHHEIIYYNKNNIMKF